MADWPGCQSSVEGGAIWSKSLVMRSGQLKIQSCTAYSGGAILSKRMKVLDGHIEIRNCTSSWQGGAIDAVLSLTMLGKPGSKNTSLLTC